MKNYFLFFLILATGISCTKSDDIDCGCNNPPPETGNFLENLNIGDKLYYTMLTGEDYHDQTQEIYNYTGDTLELEVVDKSDAGVVIIQRITAGSNMMLSDTANYYFNKDSVYTNTWKIEGDSLIIEPGGEFSQTHLLSVFRMKLNDYNVPETGLTGWRTTYPYAEANTLLYTTDYTLFGHHYDTLSVYIRNQPMSYDGNGSTVVYSESTGIVRTSTYGWWTQHGYGWDRIY